MGNMGIPKGQLRLCPSYYCQLQGKECSKVTASEALVDCDHYPCRDGPWLLVAVTKHLLKAMATLPRGDACILDTRVVKENSTDFDIVESHLASVSYLMFHW